MRIFHCNMRYAFIFFFLIISITCSYGQDTIYLKRYPNGIISKEWHIGPRKIHFKPIDTGRKMYTRLDQLIKVVSKDSIIINEEQGKKNESRVTLETNMHTAEVEFVRNVKIDSTIIIQSTLRNMKLEGIEFKMNSISEEDIGVIQCGAKPVDLYPGRKLFFNISFEKNKDQLTYKFTDFLIKYPNEKDQIVWPEKVASTMDSAAYTKSVSLLYRHNVYNWDQYFWAPINRVVEKLSIEIERMFAPSEPEELEFKDYFIGLNGIERVVNIEEDRGLIYKVNYQDGKAIKTDFLVKKKLYYLKKSNGDEIFFSRKNEEKIGDFIIMDHNGMFFDFFLGYSHFRYNYDLDYSYDTTGRVIQYPQLLSFGTRIGRKWYFGSPSSKYSMGMQMSIGSEFSAKFTKKADLTHTLMLSLGYASIWKIKPDYGIEFNLNFGIGGLGWDFGTDAFIETPWFDNAYEAVTLNPEVKYRKKIMSYGISYVELWQINANRFHKRSLLITIGKAL